MSKEEELLEGLRAIEGLAAEAMRANLSRAPQDVGGLGVRKDEARSASQLRMRVADMHTSFARIRSEAVQAIARASPTKSPDADEMVEISRDGVTGFHEVVARSIPQTNDTNCPGCGHVWSAKEIAYFKARQLQDPPYVCADCRAAGSQPYGRFK